MRTQCPETCLGMIERRNAELRAEAAANNMPRRRGASRTYRVTGHLFHFGRLLVVFGGGLCDDEARALRPAHRSPAAH
jgi:hypothetical protein